MWWGQPFGVVLFRVRRHGDHVGDGCGPPRVIFGEVTGEGRGLTLGGVVLTVNGDRDAVERQLGNGELACPSCGGVLGGWGNAVTRPVRQLKGDDEVVTPRRSRCRGCRATHVLLPAQLLSRRADAGAVIGRALEESAAGAGHRKIAGLLGRPESTVRGWLRALARGAGRVRERFTALAASLVADPPLPAPAGSPLAERGRCCRGCCRGRRDAARGGRGGAVGAGGGGDVRAAAGPVMAGGEGQRELALGGGPLSRDPR